MNVLITGGAGFVGSHVVDRLLARGDTVLVIDNYATGRRDNLKPHPNLNIVEGSIADSVLVNRAFAEVVPDIVIHAAASYRDPDNWGEDIATNVTGTANVVQSAVEHRIGRLIYFQTALCYGLQPLEQPITLEHPILPNGSSYAISKTAGEQYIELSGLDYISLRLANVYGPRNISGPLPTFYHRLTTGKSCYVMDTRRDFVFIDDLVAVVMKAIGGQGQRGPYHVSSGRDYSIKQLFDTTVDHLGIKLEDDVEVRPRHPDDAYSILLDPSNTNEDFHWSASTDLQAGVHRALDYYREYGVTETYTHLKTDAA